jgi:hypothetical protein
MMEWSVYSTKGGTLDFKTKTAALKVAREIHKRINSDKSWAAFQRELSEWEWAEALGDETLIVERL